MPDGEKTEKTPLQPLPGTLAVIWGGTQGFSWGDLLPCAMVVVVGSSLPLAEWEGARAEGRGYLSFPQACRGGSPIEVNGMAPLTKTKWMGSFLLQPPNRHVKSAAFCSLLLSLVGQSLRLSRTFHPNLFFLGSDLQSRGKTQTGFKGEYCPSEGSSIHRCSSRTCNVFPDALHTEHIYP